MGKRIATHIMNASRTCDRCGMEVPASAPQNLCPRCLFDTAVELEINPSDAEKEGNPRLSVTERAAPPPIFGDYELLGELGRGGQGVVYRARHRRLGRMVALKTIPPAHLAGAQAAERFRLEASTASRLDHPHIVPIYEVGEYDGFGYYSMKLVEGTTVDRLTSQGLPDAAGCRRVSTILAKVARAVHHAHQRGVLHRDLKPSNILLDRDHEPLVSDFGLAREASDDSSITLSEALIGTPAYLAPEVVARGSHQATVAADVYGLGAVLYYLLAGRTPFNGATIAETLHAVQDDEPARLPALNPSIPADLETICLKCLEKEPTKRYAAAQELADDLERFLRDEPILAHPMSSAGRAWRWCRRKPVVAGLAGALLAACAVGLAGVVWQWRRAEMNAANELRARQYAEAETYTADMNLVQQAWEEGNLNRAGDLLRKHLPKPGEPDQRGIEWRFLASFCNDQSQLTLRSFPSGVRSVAFTPDRHLLLAGSKNLVKILDPSDYHVMGELRDGDAAIDVLALSPRFPNLLATAGWNERNIRLWDLASHSVITKFSTENPQVNALAFSPDGSLLAWACESGEVELWDVGARINLWRHQLVHASRVLAFSPDGQTLVSGGSPHGGNAIFWDTRTGGEVPAVPPEHGGWLTGTAFSPDGRTLATAGLDESIIFWDFTTHRRLRRVPGQGDAMAFSPDGHRFAASGWTIVRVWDLTDPDKPPLTWRGHRANVRALAFAPDGRSLISASDDGTVKVWPTESEAARNVLIKRPYWITTVAISPDGRRLAAGNYHENQAELYDLGSRQWVTNFGGHAAAIQGLAFSPDGKWLATGSEDFTMRLWNLATLHLERVLTNDFQSTMPMFSPDSRVLAVAGWVPTPRRTTNSLAFWDLRTGKKLEWLRRAAPGASTVAFSHDHRLVTTGYFDGSVKIWDWSEERLVDSCTDSVAYPVWSLAFSEDDTLLASSSATHPGIYDLRARKLSRLEGYG